MSQGIYIIANDRVIENAIALLNSIRYHNKEIPVYLIPFNQEYQQVAETLQKLHNVQIFPELEFLDEFTQKISNIFGSDFLKLPNKMRKLVVWFGPLDEFLYIDTDIIVFEDIAKNLDILADFDFLCCDYHYKNEGLRNIFSSKVLELNIFSKNALQDVFNSGFWGSKKETITEKRMEELLLECAQHREYFDFAQGVTDQPILNYLVLKQMPKRINLTKIPGSDAGNWAGSKHFQETEHILYDKGKRLKYLHWAGTPLKPGTTYWKLWEYYRYLHDNKPAWQRKLLSLLKLT